MDQELALEVLLLLLAEALIYHFHNEHTEKAQTGSF